MAKGVATASPGTALAGAGIVWGPRLWMELATRPELARNAASVLLKAAGAAGVVGATELPKESGPAGEKPLKTGTGQDGKKYGFFASTKQWMLMPGGLK